MESSHSNSPNASVTGQSTPSVELQTPPSQPQTVTEEHRNTTEVVGDKRKVKSVVWDHAKKLKKDFDEKGMRWRDLASDMCPRWKLPKRKKIYAGCFRPMETPEAEYAAFEEKVKQTVYLDNVSPQVTESVVRTALSQFGTVKSVQFIPNYLESKNIPQCALVEMENAQQADAVVSAIEQFPFMMSGMPRPVRARPSKVEMFDDRPAQPGRRISCGWVEADDPDFEVAKKLKRLTEKHAAEASFLLKQQLQEEENLTKQQNEALKANYKKYEMLENVIGDGTARRLAKHYKMRVTDE